MLDIVLNILTDAGIALLVLVVVLLIALLLILFFPITYRAYLKKNPEEMSAWVKANWLFGLLRVRFFYPEPGNLTVKLLWFILFDTAQKAKTNGEDDQKKKSASESGETSKIKEKTGSVKHEDTDIERTANTDNSASLATGDKTENITENIIENKTENGADTNGAETFESTTGQEAAQEKGLKHWFLAKYGKIKYTIQKIYDKIKHIWENITFYKTLLQDEQTVALLKHVWFRFRRILKNIRPREIKGDILLGTGSPDTTGYAYGVYGMLLPWLGKHINVTPDFTQAILEGELYVAGHITIFQVLLHSLMILFDKKLRLLIRRIKTHKM